MKTGRPPLEVESLGRRSEATADQASEAGIFHGRGRMATVAPEGGFDIRHGDMGAAFDFRIPIAGSI